MNPVQVVVRVRDDAHARIAWAVASIPGLEGPIGMLGRRPPASWTSRVRRVTSSTETGIVVDPDPDDDGIVVVARESDRPGITHASPRGLAESLKARLGEPGADAVWTTPGNPARKGQRFAFPAPVGVVRGEPGEVAVPGRFAAVGAFGTGRSLVCVDDRPFMETICMAAGAAIASTDLTRSTPVWERAEDYIAACEELGLVVAETVSS